MKEYGTADDPEPSFRNTQLYTFFNAKSTKLVTALKACGTLAPDGFLYHISVYPMSNWMDGMTVVRWALPSTR